MKKIKALYKQVVTVTVRVKKIILSVVFGLIGTTSTVLLGLIVYNSLMSEQLIHNILFTILTYFLGVITGLFAVATIVLVIDGPNNFLLEGWKSEKKQEEELETLVEQEDLIQKALDHYFNRFTRKNELDQAAQETSENLEQT